MMILTRTIVEHEKEKAVKNDKSMACHPECGKGVTPQNMLAGNAATKY